MRGDTGRPGTRVLKSWHFTTNLSPSDVARSTCYRLGRQSLPRPNRPNHPGLRRCQFPPLFPADLAGRQHAHPDGRAAGKRGLQTLHPCCRPACQSRTGSPAHPRQGSRQRLPGPHRPRPHRLPRRPECRPVDGRHAGSPGPRRTDQMAAFKQGQHPAALRRDVAAPRTRSFPGMVHRPPPRRTA